MHLVDPSEKSLLVSRQNLSGFSNIEFHLASASDLPFPDCYLDFAYSLGVLHHTPNTFEAICNIVTKLKPHAPLLLYLYYAFDNRGLSYRLLWSASDLLRRLISRLPFQIKIAFTQILAFLVYWPLARAALIAERIGVCPKKWPLSFYRDKPIYVLQTDALDRFGTRLEKRFTRTEIRNMMEGAGLTDIRFSEHEPFWCAVGIRSG